MNIDVLEVLVDNIVQNSDQLIYMKFNVLDIPLRSDWSKFRSTNYYENRHAVKLSEAKLIKVQVG